MTGIFINYRRDDAPGVAGRLYDHLAKSFSRRDLFIDVDAPANAEVVVLALTYLGFAALFLMTDSLQVVIAGMLRGLFDTRVPMWIAAFGYWILGLPLGALLAFGFGFAGVGIWTGIVSSLGVVGLVMTARWVRREKYGLVPRRAETSSVS